MAEWASEHTDSGPRVYVLIIFSYFLMLSFSHSHTHRVLYIIHWNHQQRSKNSTTESFILGFRAKYSHKVAVLFKDMNHSEY